VQDNLKTGVNRVYWHDPEVNKTYREMSDHYNTAVIPARIRHPKENWISHLYTAGLLES